MTAERASNPPDAARLAEIYSNTAAFYDQVVAAHQAAAKDVAIALLAPSSGQTVLEIGAGTGWCLTRIISAAPQAKCIAVDLASGMLEVTRARLDEAGQLDNALLAVADSRTLPFANERFDRILCTYTLEVMAEDDIAAVLPEMRRLLTPNGQLVLADLTFGEAGDDAVLTEAWQRGYESDPEFYGGARPLRLSPYVEAAGLRLTHRRYVAGGTGWPSEVIVATRGT